MFWLAFTSVDSVCLFVGRIVVAVGIADLAVNGYDRWKGIGKKFYQKVKEKGGKSNGGDGE